MKKLLNWKLSFFLIALLTIFLRLYQLGDVPYGVSNDESILIYNAYSIWNTGRSILGDFLPLAFFQDFSPVPIYLTAPFVGILEISSFSGRLAGALLSIGSVFLVFLITENIARSKRIALFSMLVMAMSPWHLQMSRAVFDVTFALFFFLLATYVFLKKVESGSILWSLPFFLLGFYSYNATKLYFILFIPLLIFVFRKFLLKRKKELSIFVFCIFLILLSFMVVYKKYNITRAQVTLMFNTPEVSRIVDLERTKNIAPQSLRAIFSNKPFFYLRAMRENYLEAFSPQFLFLYGETGENSQMFSIYGRGEMYIIELPLLLLGLYFLIFSKNKLARNFILLSLLIGPVPSMFTISRSFVSRDLMMLPFLCMIVGYGINFILEKLKSFKNFGLRYIFLLVFILIYTFLLISYFYQYYYRWTVYGAEPWFRSTKELIIYLNEGNKFKNIYLANTDRLFFLQYGLYNKVDPKIIGEAIKTNKLGNITIFQSCLNKNEESPSEFLPKNTLYVYKPECYKNFKTPKKIVNYTEPLQTIWSIYEN